jgi:hypothetical protein
LTFGLVDDALNLETRGLWFIGNRGDLLADELIQQSGLPGIRPADKSYVAAAVTFVYLLSHRFG